MKTNLQRLAAAIGLAAAGVSMAATPDHVATLDLRAAELEPQIWRVDGGDLRLRFNDDFLDLFGVRVESTAAVKDSRNPAYAIFPLLMSEGLRFNAPDGGFDRFVGGKLQVRGGFMLRLADGSAVDLRDPVIRPSVENPLHLELVGADGKAWVYVTHLMYEFVGDSRVFHVATSDLRAMPRLAKRVGSDALADAYIGELQFDARVQDRSRETAAMPKGNVPKFHGTPHPNGGIYEADVTMENYSMSFSRCRLSTGGNGCDGAGADDGQVVFTPSATLRNSNTDRTADVPWYEKFTGGTNPYGYPYPNADQHPYLIWNLYRIVDDQLEQIGVSGLKHAWLTTNTGCAAGAFTGNGHILGLGCGDTYGTGNNDDPTDLGPRSELLPALGMWGRCGSVFDPNCVGSLGVVDPNGNYGSRMIVRESQMLVPGSTFWSETWYVVQDDVNIYNTMGRRTIAPVPGGGGWVTGSQGTFTRAPVINAWVDPVANPTRNVELIGEPGRARVAVKVKTLSACPEGSGLSGTCYRYDYVVNNFDFTTATTSGTQPNLRVTGGKGFNQFSIARPVATGIHLPTSVNFADTDTNAGNNWTAIANGNSIQWTAPEGNELNWGTLYRFSFVSNAAPATTAQTAITLTPTGAASPLTANIAGPEPFGARVMHDGFEGN
ncbi:MAG: hypothetical protein ACT4NL_10775 [Pseudomarimonas sp.]